MVMGCVVPLHKRTRLATFRVVSTTRETQGRDEFVCVYNLIAGRDFKLAHANVSPTASMTPILQHARALLRIAIGGV